MRLIDADAMIDRLKEWGTKDKTDKALYNFTLNRINEQPTITPEPYWIPVTERLPDISKSVLICDIDGDIYLGHRTKYGDYYPDFTMIELRTLLHGCHCQSLTRG